MKTNYVKRLLFGVVVTCICLPLNAMSGRSYGGKGLVFEPYTPPESYNKTVNVGQTQSKKPKKKIPCDIGGCSKNAGNRAYFDSENFLKSHKALVHYICPYCPNLDAFNSYEELIGEHYLEKNHERDYCQYCRKFVYVKPDNGSVLRRHENRCFHNDNQDKPTTYFAYHDSCVLGRSYKEKINIVQYNFPEKNEKNKSASSRVIGHDKFGHTSAPKPQRAPKPQENCQSYYPQQSDHSKYDSSQPALRAGFSPVQAHLAHKTQMCDVTVDNEMPRALSTPGEFDFEYKCYNCLRIFEYEAQAHMHDCR